MKLKNSLTVIIYAINERLLGIISHTDLLRISYADLDESDELVVSVIYEMYSIPDIITRMPVFVDIGNTIKETAEILAR